MIKSSAREKGNGRDFSVGRVNLLSRLRELCFFAFVQLEWRATLSKRMASSCRAAIFPEAKFVFNLHIAGARRASPMCHESRNCNIYHTFVFKNSGISESRATVFTVGGSFR